MKTLIQLAAAAALGLAAGCASHATYSPGYGYGGSGVQYMRLDAAQSACIRAAEAQGGWHVEKIRDVDQVGRDKARVKMNVVNPAGRDKITCEYDGRTGGAFLR